ncbi:MAG: DUF3857 domain-containing protein, partial [Pyrinomonadaceae bacterium]|nr:DUF3857 domain-containing protein [Pyrinomonadaceae bacterium]
MKRKLLLFVLIIGLTNLIIAQKKPRKVVRPKAPPPIFSISKVEEQKIGLTVERYINTYQVNSDGTSVQTLEVLQKLDSDILAKTLSVDKTEFNSDLTDIEVIEAYKILANGKKVLVDKSQIRIKPTPQTEAAPTFSSIKILEVEFGELKKGDSIYSKYIITDKNASFEGKFSALVIFPLFFDYKYAEINVIAPSNYPIYFDAVDIAGGKVSDENGQTKWQWKKVDMVGVPIKKVGEQFADSSPRIAITSFSTYDELGSAYWNEAKKKVRVTPEVKKLADDITKDITEPKLQASAIYEWVNKNIRYLSIILERGGWIPHDVNAILESGYGDCKDYTVLLQSLLSAKNIESVPVLVNADQKLWFPKVASPEMLNHAILYIPSLNLYADATAPNTRLGLISAVMRGKTSVLSGEKTGKHLIAEESADENQFLSDVVVTFTPNGEVRSISNNSYRGQPEMIFRPLFADSEFLTKSTFFVEMLLTYYGVTGTGKLLSVSNSHKIGEPFTIEMEINLNNHTTFLSKGSFSMPIMLNLHSLLEMEGLVKDESKTSPSIVGTNTFKESFEVKFPIGVVIDKLPETVKIDNKVASLLSEYKLENDSIKIKRELIIKKGIIQPEEYADFRSVIKKTVEIFTDKISYTTTPEFQKIKKSNSVNSPI